MKTSLIALLSLSTIQIAGCKEEEELPVPQTPPSKAPSGSEGNLATAPAGYLANAAKAEQSMEKNIDTAAVNNALQLFAVQEGRIPENLDELVEKKYLSKLPTPPFGSKLQYDKTEGKVTVVKE